MNTNNIFGKTNRSGFCTPTTFHAAGEGTINSVKVGDTLYFRDSANKREVVEIRQTVKGTFVVITADDYISTFEWDIDALRQLYRTTPAKTKRELLQEDGEAVVRNLSVPLEAAVSAIIDRTIAMTKAGQLG